MKTVTASRYAVFFSIAILGCLADLGTKHWAFTRLQTEPPVVAWAWEPYIGFETSLNEGALFGLGRGLVLVFAGLSIVAAAAILVWLFYFRGASDLLLTVSLGCVTAGILGNLYDRLGLHGLVWSGWNHPDFAMHGQPVYAVRDFILFQINREWRWPNFNIADSLLVCGACLLAFQAFRSPEADAEHAKPADKSKTTA